jgi:hypothetical protein
MVNFRENISATIYDERFPHCLIHGGAESGSSAPKNRGASRCPARQYFLAFPFIKKGD